MMKKQRGEIACLIQTSMSLQSPLEDTPISPVVCADMLPLAIAESLVCSYADKNREDHPDGRPYLYGMRPLVHNKV